MTDFFEEIERRKMARGMKHLNKRCFCGKMKVNHTTQEANRCKKEMDTETVGKILTLKEANEIHPRNI